MGPLFISFLFWLVGFLVILSGPVIGYLLKRMKKKMDQKSEETRHDDNEASFVYAILENVIDIIPWFYIRLVFTIVGMVIIALGFVSLGFWTIK